MWIAGLQFQDLSGIAEGPGHLPKSHIEVTNGASMVRHPSEGVSRRRSELVAGKQQPSGA